MSEKTVSVGVRMAEEGIEFFGTEEVNELLGRGYSVQGIEPDEVMVEPVPPEESGEEEEIMTLVGFAVRVQLQKPSRGGMQRTPIRDVNRKPSPPK